jgi:hypothetical protein
MRDAGFRRRYERGDATHYGARKRNAEFRPTAERGRGMRNFDPMRSAEEECGYEEI